MSASLLPRFLADLAQVYATLQPQALSVTFLSDLKKVFDTLPVASDADLAFLANRFDKWCQVTRETVRTRLVELSDDDPLKCPISLFRTMDSGRLETAHTSTLAWLLDPRNNDEHGFGDALLRVLLGHLANRQHFDRLDVEGVQSEYPLDGSAGKGRFDVLAKGEWASAGESARWILVIEAKVDSLEGEGQLDKYDGWLDSYGKGPVAYRVFLTPKGREPEGGCEDWKALSFPQLVEIFQEVYPSLKAAPGFHFLRYYLAGVLQDICGWPRRITADAPDPYSILSYLKSVQDSHSEGASHDAAR